MDYIGKQKILLPTGVNMENWAVVACDQFTSQPAYWEKLDKFVGDSPSALRITLPEIFLGESETRIPKINETMEKYLASGLFREIDGFVLVEREVEEGGKRIGLVMSVDLDAYEWERVRCPIRATEDTILDRLPPRIAIRRNAKIELPHILLLVDDEKREIIEPIYKNKENLEKLYDFPLNMGGGQVVGYKVENTAELREKFYSLLDADRQKAKYGCDAGVLFTVGDGNHSLAVAKTMWKEIKKTLTEEERKTHPARYALVEVVNLYDEAMTLEPIHRVVSGGNQFIKKLKDNLSGDGTLKIITPDGESLISCPAAASEAITCVQNIIEDHIKSGEEEVDYIHGDSHLVEVVKAGNFVGIFMPLFGKDELFNYVINVGNLPKKAFSIGGPEFKKYYLEAKLIK